MNRRDFLKTLGVTLIASLVPVKTLWPFQDTAGGYIVPEEFHQMLVGVQRQSALMLNNLGMKFSMTKVYTEWADRVGKDPVDLKQTERQQALLNAVLSDTSTID